MPEIILDGQRKEDTFRFIERWEEAMPGQDVIVPLPLLQEPLPFPTGAGGRLGVRLEGAEGPEELEGNLDRLALVEVRFPVFTDGRGYTTARLLREKYAFRGELRASGDVFRETLYYLSQCGFNAFVLRPGESIDSALEGLDVFSEGYQSTALRESPLFRRRLTGNVLPGKST